MLLGCIGDDFTGSSDLGNTLAKGGMSTVQYCGIPEGPADASVEAGIVALKSRSIPPDEAVSQSLEALAWLMAQGCRQILFKYCSTFDSTREGNIGPVAEALARATSCRTPIVCPVYPSLGRRLFQGHLFVGDRLLSESGMEKHPLTPMTDPDIRRWLGHQTSLPVAHIPQAIVAQGRAAIRAELDRIGEAGRHLVVVDAIADADLVEIGAAAEGLELITGGSGIALGLPENFRAAEMVRGANADWKGEAGDCVALSGSCSIATRAQVARHEEAHPVLHLDPEAVLSGETDAERVADWIAERRDAYPMVASTAAPDAVAALQKRHGVAATSHAIEGLFARVAALCLDRGMTRIVVAGGETSGAVVSGLGVPALEIGPEIAPGVPAMAAHKDGRRLTLALKSGNFGAVDFFARAREVLGANAA